MLKCLFLLAETHSGCKDVFKAGCGKKRKEKHSWRLISKDCSPWYISGAVNAETILQTGGEKANLQLGTLPS